MPQEPGERLQKALARLGMASRREAEDWIRGGRLTVNGTVATLGMRVRISDQIRLDGRLVRQRPPAHTHVFVYHRSPGESLVEPRATDAESDEHAAPDADESAAHGVAPASGDARSKSGRAHTNEAFASAGDVPGADLRNRAARHGGVSGTDEGREKRGRGAGGASTHKSSRGAHGTVTGELEYRAPLQDRLPKRAGRRFIAVSPMPSIDGGLELLTSDGELAEKLQRAVRRLDSEFSVRVHGELGDGQRRQIREGVLDRGTLEVKSLESSGGEATNRWYTVQARGASGKDIRQLFERQGAIVSRVLRTKLGPVQLTRQVARGQFRKLNDAELASLTTAISPEAPSQPPATREPRAPKHRSQPSRPHVKRAHAKRPRRTGKPSR